MRSMTSTLPRRCRRTILGRSWKRSSSLSAVRRPARMPARRLRRAQREQATTALLARLPGPRLKVDGRTAGGGAALCAAARGCARRRRPWLADPAPDGARDRAAPGSGQCIAELDDAFWLELEELQAAAAALDRAESPQPYHGSAWRNGVQHGNGSVRSSRRWRCRWSKVCATWASTSPLDARARRAADGAVLHGVAGSPGVVTGPARVIHGPDEFGQMRRGDILVARITTPAWTPLFALAAGVVTDVGGPLSHSSIVAREYHIPAVLGTGAGDRTAAKRTADHGGRQCRHSCHAGCAWGGGEHTGGGAAPR